MRNLFYIFVLFTSLSSLAQWVKISDEDYVWGPFKIYNISLFSENGSYVVGQRPLMLSLKYEKPVEGRDFAISLARSWSNLGFTLPEQDSLVDNLRKIMPNIRKDDVLSYIALSDSGYFILNDIVIPEEFNQDFNDAIVSVWLDPRVEIGRNLLKGFPITLPEELAKEKNSNDNSFETQIVDHTVEENLLKQPDKEISEVKVEVSVEVEKEATFEVKEWNGTDKKNSGKEYHNPEIEILPPFDPLPKNSKIAKQI